MILKLSGHVMQLDQCFILSILTHCNQSKYFAYLHSEKKYGIILGGNSSHSKRIFTLQKKIVRIMAGTKPRNLCRSLFKKLEIFLFLLNIYFHQWTSSLITQNFFRQIQLYTMLTHGIRTIFIDQLPAFHVFRKVLTLLASKSSTVYHLVSKLFRIKRRNLYIVAL
jgi:hypothetical protein